MKEYTKTITVQAVQWTGNVDELMKELCKWSIAPSEWFCTSDMVVRFSEELGLVLCPKDNYLVWVKFEGTNILSSVSPEDFQRDYKEVAP